jgi:hypothetical protein
LWRRKSPRVGFVDPPNFRPRDEGWWFLVVCDGWMAGNGAREAVAVGRIKSERPSEGCGNPRKPQGTNDLRVFLDWGRVLLWVRWGNGFKPTLQHFRRVSVSGRVRSVALIGSGAYITPYSSLIRIIEGKTLPIHIKARITALVSDFRFRSTFAPCAPRLRSFNLNQESRAPCVGRSP